MDRLKPYLPLAVRAFWTLAAGLGPIVAALVAKLPVTNEVLTASLVAGGAAWKRWHPSASVSALSDAIKENP